MTTILIVDDDPDLRLLTRRLVGVLGPKTLEARNGVEGEKLALEHQPDLVLLDIMMPGQDGLETCAKLRQSGYAAPIILMSAMPEAAGRQQAVECGASAYIQKPMTRATLKLHIDQLQVT